MLRYWMPETEWPGKNRRITFELLDITGKCVSYLTIEDPGPGIHEKKVDVSHLPAGIYLYMFRSGDQIRTGKISRVN